LIINLILDLLYVLNSLLEKTNGPVEESSAPINVPEPPIQELKMSPVYSLAVQSEAVWLLTGMEVGLYIMICLHVAYIQV
jgi:hypothetical protein